MCLLLASSCGGVSLALWGVGSTMRRHVLRVEVEMGSVDLVEPPQQVLGGLVHVIAARVVGKVVAQW